MSSRDDSWILTASGGRFWPLDPRPEDVRIEDIAHHLANLCRFTGACKRFYSVAEHSIVGSYHCKFPLRFLLHDAAEAYIGDWATPIKSELYAVDRPTYYVRTLREVEARIMAAIETALGLPPMTAEEAAEVKRVDTIMLATEKRDLMPESAWKWVHVPEGVEPLPPSLAGTWFSDVKDTFLFLLRDHLRYREGGAA